MFVGDIQEGERSVHVCLYENTRILDRVVHMGFGGEVDDSLNIVLVEDLFHKFSVADVTFYKYVSWVVLDLFQVFEAAGISEQIEIYNSIFRILL